MCLVSNAAKTVSKEDAESCLAYRQKVEDAYAVDPQSIQEHLQSPYMRYAKKMFEKRTTEVEKTLKRKNSK